LFFSSDIKNIAQHKINNEVLITKYQDTPIYKSLKDKYNPSNTKIIMFAGLVRKGKSIIYKIMVSMITIEMLKLAFPSIYKEFIKPISVSNIPTIVIMWQKIFVIINQFNYNPFIFFIPNITNILIGIILKISIILKLAGM